MIHKVKKYISEKVLQPLTHESKNAVLGEADRKIE